MQLHDLRFATLILLVSTLSVWAAPPVTFDVSNELQQPKSGDVNLTLPLTIALPHNLTTSPLTIALPQTLTTSPPPLSLRFISLSQSSWQLNLLKEPSNLPPDPFYYEVPDSGGIILKFHNYGKPMDAGGTSQVLLLAGEEASHHSPAERMDILPVVIRIRDVYYAFNSPWITWGRYASAIRGVKHFVSTYQAVELQYEVKLNGVIYGWGRLAAVGL